MIVHAGHPVRTTLTALLTTAVIGGVGLALAVPAEANTTSIPCREGHICLYSESNFAGSVIEFRNRIRPHFLVGSFANNTSERYCMDIDGGASFYETASYSAHPSFGGRRVDEAYPCSGR